MKNFLLAAILWSALATQAQTNHALSFDGSSQDVVIGAPIPNNSSYTKEAWVLSTTLSGARNIISSLNTPFWTNGGNLMAGQAGSYSLVSDPNPLPLNQWVYVAVTYDAPTTTMKLYRDGILVSTNTSAAAYGSETTYIGAHNGGMSYWQGNIDEVRIWSTALSQSQLKRNMFKGPLNNATGLLIHYKFDEGSGSTLTNSCTNTTGLDGTIVNSPVWTASPIQFAANALNFDGVNDIVNIPSNSSLDITGAITLEAWVFPTSNVTNIQDVINKSSNTQNTGYIFPRTDDGWASSVFYLHIGGWKTLSAPFPSLNTWHHLAATYDGAMMKIYVDGVLSASRAQTGSITVNTNALTFGRQPGFPESYFGSADEFRIWNVARTQAEILANMNTEIDPANSPGLVSYYTANQGITAGTNTDLVTLPDMAGNNNATLQNFALAGAGSNFIAQNGLVQVLPLRWLSFAAQKQGENVLLSWTTAQEQNTKDFVVQHSLNGRDWLNLAIAPASINSSNATTYQYLHTHPGSGAHYYRIEQRDENANYSFSDVRMVQLLDANAEFNVLSNPVSNKLLQLQINRQTTLALYDYNGALIYKENFSTGTQTINLSQLAKGVYLLKGISTSSKIVLQ